MSGSAPRTPDQAGHATGGRGPDRERRWLRSTQLAGIVGTLLAVASLAVGVLALKSPASPRTPPATTSPPGTPPPRTPDGGGGTTSGSGSGQQPGRFLADLEPDAGGGNVQRTGAHSLLMKCGTGESDDRFRETTYNVPQSGYRSFATSAAVSGEREKRAQVFLLVDERVVAQPVVFAGETQRLTWTGGTLVRLALRISCEPGVAAVTFTEPGLSR